MTFVSFMNAPISFQTLVTSVRRGIHWKFIICYIDVIRISQTPSIKSYFAMIELKCLMHLITCKGVECYSPKNLSLVNIQPLPIPNRPDASWEWKITSGNM